MSFDVVPITTFVITVDCAICRTEVRTNVIVQNENDSVPPNERVNREERAKLTDWCVDHKWWFDDHAKSSKAHLCPTCVKKITEEG